MIDDFLIKSAIKIRTDFLGLDSKLSSYQDELKEIAESFVTISKNLENIKNKVGKKPVDVIQKEIFNQLNTLEDKAKRIETLVNPLNEQMEKLKSDEEKLWNKIKKKYPREKEEDLIAEIHKYIKK